jgi:hypothetical protein
VTVKGIIAGTAEPQVALSRVELAVQSQALRPARGWALLQLGHARRWNATPGQA